MISKIRQTVLLATVAGISIAMGTSAEATLGQAVGLLPADSDVVMAINMTAMQNTNSLMSVVTREELEAAALEELGKKGLDQPVSNSGEAAMRVAVTGAKTATRTDYVAFGLNLDLVTGAEPTVKAVLIGDFTADMPTAVAPLGASASGDGAVVQFVTETNTTVTAACPSQNVLVMSEDAAWATGVMQTVAANQNLTASGSAFNAVAATLSGRAPDAIVYVPGRLLQQTLGSDPTMQAMAAPILKSNGVLVSLLPGTGAEPLLELSANFSTDQDAVLAKQWADSMMQLVKMQAMGAGSQITDPDQRAEFDKQMAIINSITTSANGSNLTLKAPMLNLPTRDEIRANFMEAMRSGLDGNASPGALLPINR